MGEWISVKDRLPERMGMVLVYFHSKLLDSVLPAYYANGKWYKYISGRYFYSDYITHWMPLPERPKEK